MDASLLGWVGEGQGQSGRARDERFGYDMGVVTSSGGAVTVQSSFLAPPTPGLLFP